MADGCSRREFLRRAGVLVGGAMASGSLAGADPNEPVGVRADAGARSVGLDWGKMVGFNLLEMFTMRSRGDWREDDFRWMAEWGFNFVRLPLCYRLWIREGNDYLLDESMLAKVDRAVALGGKYGLHVSLNLHRAPGYSVNREYEEPLNLWKDEAAAKAFCFHWGMLAQRYRSVGRDALSFHLVNEPGSLSRPEVMTRADHERVMRAAVGAIREVSPSRAIVVDGMEWGGVPATELVDLGVVHGTRAYSPFCLTHYRASWANTENCAEPTWPGEGWDLSRLGDHYGTWRELVRQGQAVMCCEGGAYNQTRHGVVLSWLRDVLEVLGEGGIGFALWNFRGSFGVLDSGRQGVEYEDFRGHKLDRALLELMQGYARKVGARRARGV